MLLVGIILLTRVRIVWFAFFWSMDTLRGGDCLIQKTVNTVFWIAGLRSQGNLSKLLL